MRDLAIVLLLLALAGCAAPGATTAWERSHAGFHVGGATTAQLFTAIPSYRNDGTVIAGSWIGVNVTVRSDAGAPHSLMDPSGATGFDPGRVWVASSAGSQVLVYTTPRWVGTTWQSNDTFDPGDAGTVTLLFDNAGAFRVGEPVTFGFDGATVTIPGTAVTRSTWTG